MKTGQTHNRMPITARYRGISIHVIMAEDISVTSWIEGTVCSERYKQLAAERGNQFFEPWRCNYPPLVPKVMGMQPSFSSAWQWPTGFTRMVMPSEAVLMQTEDATGVLSGPQWVGLFPASTSLDDLSAAFRSSVQDFVDAITAAGGTVNVISTLYSSERAYLMHWAWEIARGNITAEEVDEKHPMAGVSIQWNHGNDQVSIAAAQVMNDLYGNRYPPSLHSDSITGNAIDMTISVPVGKTIARKDGTLVTITTNTMTNPVNLVPVGASYGVFHILGNHWSSSATGR